MHTETRTRTTPAPPAADSLFADDFPARRGEAIELPGPEQRPPLPTDPRDGWVVPPRILLLGQLQRVRYDGAGPWRGRAGCAGGLSPGCRRLRCYLFAHFPAIERIGGYACRPINCSSQRCRTTMSLHGSGRALDIYIPRLPDGSANAAVGDPIANWLVSHAEQIGIQYLIWNRVRWRGRPPHFAPYHLPGGSPHTDHIHVELNRDGAAMRTPWFQGLPPPSQCFNLLRAIRLNRRWARRLGWGTRLDAVQRALGLPADNRDERAFALAVGRWQRAHRLGPYGDSDGILGPRTWRRLRRSLSPAPATEQATLQATVTDWSRVPIAQRRRHVMERLINRYGFPAVSAAALVGNLEAESGLIPQRIEGSPASQPMTARDRRGRRRTFTAAQVAARSFGEFRETVRSCVRRRLPTTSGTPVPQLPGVGLAQWSYWDRRRDLFLYPYQGAPLGAAILYDMDAQIDYLVAELRGCYPGLYRRLRQGAWNLRTATGEVTYHYAIPRRLLDRERRRLPRSAAQVQQVFDERTRLAQRALTTWQTAAATAP